jgi:hypothetical protein
MRQPPVPGERVTVELSPGTRRVPAIVVGVAQNGHGEGSWEITVDVGDDDAQFIVTVPVPLVHPLPAGDDPGADRERDPGGAWSALAAGPPEAVADDPVEGEGAGTDPAPDAAGGPGGGRPAGPGRAYARSGPAGAGSGAGYGVGGYGPGGYGVGGYGPAGYGLGGRDIDYEPDEDFDDGYVYGEDYDDDRGSGLECHEYDDDRRDGAAAAALGRHQGRDEAAEAGGG